MQKRDSTIHYNAQKISDADAAVAAYDMLTACEKNLADSTYALQQTRKEIPKKVKQAKLQGAGIGGLGAIIAMVLYRIFN